MQQESAALHRANSALKESLKVEEDKYTKDVYSLSTSSLRYQTAYANMQEDYQLLHTQLQEAKNANKQLKDGWRKATEAYHCHIQDVEVRLEAADQLHKQHAQEATQQLEDLKNNLAHQRGRFQEAKRDLVAVEDSKTMVFGKLKVCQQTLQDTASRLKATEEKGRLEALAWLEEKQDYEGRLKNKELLIEAKETQANKYRQRARELSSLNGALSNQKKDYILALYLSNIIF